MFTLRPYQEKAVDAALKHFRRQQDPALIVLPTGAGKSLVIAELARLARSRVLVLAHVKELVEQNYHKYQSYGLEAGIFSAGLGRKDSKQKVIFGSVQSVARAPKQFFNDFSLLIIDEAHRVSLDQDSQYLTIIDKLKLAQPRLCILGLTATPFRMDEGWIYQFHYKGIIRATESRLFNKCIFEMSLKEMIQQKYLTPPIKIESPVASYDFSSLQLAYGAQSFSTSEIEQILKQQKRITPVIVANIVEMSEEREGVLIFTASVRHAEEVLSFLPQSNSAIVVSSTSIEERDQIINDLKSRKLKFLVNVSVLTTGFDAPHVDLIAILRPTESVSLYQQIVGRGLRLSEGKEDCLVLDYTASGHSLFNPEIETRKPSENATPVEVTCPECGFINNFWGIVDSEGNIYEHFGRRCHGATENSETLEIIPCGYRFRFKICPECGTENDIAARECNNCHSVLVDNDTKLKQARAMQDAHVMKPDLMQLEKTTDKKGRERLEVRYYDLDGECLKEFFYLNNPAARKAFYYNFSRMHSRRPEKELKIENPEQALGFQSEFKMPMFVIARKQKYFWQIKEKIFSW